MPGNGEGIVNVPDTSTALVTVALWNGTFFKSAQGTADATENALKGSNNKASVDAMSSSKGRFIVFSFL
jgi:hypothetical protein